LLQDLKRSWERRYLVLYNDGKLRYFDSRLKKEEKGSLDLRFFCLQEVEEDMEIDDEEEGEERQALKVANQFFKIEKGKQFGESSGISHATARPTPAASAHGAMSHFCQASTRASTSSSSLRPSAPSATSGSPRCRPRWPSSIRSRPSSRRSTCACR